MKTIEPILYDVEILSPEGAWRTVMHRAALDNARHWRSTLLLCGGKARVTATLHSGKTKVVVLP